MAQNQSKIVFITGGNGFIGSNLARFLIDKKFSVNLLVRKGSNKWRIKDISNKLTIHEGDLENVKLLKKLLIKIKPSYIFHLASYGNSSDENDFNKIIDINIGGLKNLLEASSSVNYKKLIISGSSSEYGFKKTAMKESDNLEPNSFYSAAKGSATLISQSYAKEKNKPILILRLFSVYGPYEEKTRLIPIIINSALKNKKVYVTKQPLKRDFIFIDDVVEGFYKAMVSKYKNGEIFNIGTGKQFTNLDVVKIIESILKIKLKIGSFPKRKWDSNIWVSDISKAKKLLKWAPKQSLENGLKKSIEFYRIQN